MAARAVINLFRSRTFIKRILLQYIEQEVAIWRPTHPYLRRQAWDRVWVSMVSYFGATILLQADLFDLLKMQSAFYALKIRYINRTDQDSFWYFNDCLRFLDETSTNEHDDQDDHVSPE
jgi:hypothetical protein